jgi:hypothetical protein
LKLYHKIVQKEKETLVQHKENILAIMRAELPLTIKEKERRVIEYIQEALGIKEAQEEQRDSDESE